MLRIGCTSSNQKVSESQYTYSIFGTKLNRNRHLNTFANILLADFNSIGIIFSFILNKFYNIMGRDIDFVILEI